MRHTNKRELMDEVNSKVPGPISAPHASGRATMKTRALLQISDRALVDQLSEDVAADLADLD